MILMIIQGKYFENVNILSHAQTQSLDHGGILSPGRTQMLQKNWKRKKEYFTAGAGVHGPYRTLHSSYYIKSPN